jgi:hypothetical protein
MTFAQPAPAEAGVLGSIKNAAKSVGGAVKKTAVGVGGAVKSGVKVITPSPGHIIQAAKNTGVVGPIKTVVKTVGGAAGTVGRGTVTGAKAVGSGALKVGGGITEAGKRIGTGFKQTALDVAHSRPAKAVVKEAKTIVGKFHN